MQLFVTPLLVCFFVLLFRQIAYSGLFFLLFSYSSTSVNRTVSNSAHVLLEIRPFFGIEDVVLYNILLHAKSIYCDL